MTWYYYLNYRIFKFYERKRNSMPAWFSFLASTTLTSINFISLIGIAGFMYPFLNNINKIHALILMAICALLNYLVLYRGKYYVEVFDDFEKYESRYNSWEKSVPIYIISSIVLFFIVLAIADYRHDGHF